MPTTQPATALDMLHTTVHEVTAADPADSAAALRTIHEALSLTAIANRLIHEALLEFEFEVYWPGENFLADARKQHLALAVERLRSALPTPAPPSTHDQMTTLTPAQIEPQAYHPHQPDGYDGVVCDPDPTEKARQLLLHRTQTVASANKEVWIQVQLLLRQALDHFPDTQQRTAFQIAALLVEEILHPNPGTGRGDIDARILGIEADQSSADR